MEKNYYVYINTNKRQTVYYVGITSNIGKRLWQHMEKADKKSFTYRYNVDKLVYYEVFEDVYSAISREKQIKGWTRNKKIELIKTLNPNFKNLLDCL